MTIKELYLGSTHGILKLTNKMKKGLLVISTFIAFTPSHSQDFTRSKNKATGELVISFTDFREPPQIPVVVTKTIKPDGSETYQIGCYLIRSAAPVDMFMKSGVILNFEDKTTMTLKGDIYSSPIYGGKFQIHIKQGISQTDLKLLQLTAIESFEMGGFTVEIGKWQRQDLKNVFIKIETEKLK